MSVLAISNLKGGVGKSTISQNLAVALAGRGINVCIADTDSEQKTTTKWASLRNEKSVKIPVFPINPEKVAHDILGLKQRFDLVIVDGTPALTELTTRIIILSDMVLVPILPGGGDIWALENFLERYQEAKITKESYGGKVDIAIIFNRFSERTTLDKEILNAIEALAVKSLTTKLSNRVSYREATITGSGVTEMKDDKAKQEIAALANEIIAIFFKKIEPYGEKN
jgi:chromosome partitioning protein